MISSAENRAFYEINVEKCGTAREATDDNIIWRMWIAYWMNKTTDTHSKYLILIAFPR